MKRTLHIVFFVLLMQFSVSAQESLKVSFEQTVENNTLFIDIMASTNGGPDFKLGSCNFPFEDVSGNLDFTTASLVDSLSGKYSSLHNSDSYSGPSFTAGSFAHVYISKNFYGSGTGITIGSDKERIARLAIPITDPCSFSELKWIKNRGELTSFDRKKIGSTSSMNDAGVFTFKPTLNQPIVTFDNDQTLEASISPSYQWYQDGILIPGATQKTLIIEDEGTYFVESSDGCATKTSDLYVYSKAGPVLTLTAFPNPYLGQTTINYNLPEDQKVSVEIFDVVGNRITTLVNTNQSKGKYNLNFAAQSLGYTAGVYIVKLKAGDIVRTQRIVELNAN